MKVKLALVAAALAAIMIGESRVAALADQFPRGLMVTTMDKDKTCTIETRPVTFGTYDALSTQLQQAQSSLATANSAGAEAAAASAGSQTRAGTAAESCSRR